jgi:RNA polymerase sigma factor (sigma-70 family)
MQTDRVLDREAVLRALFDAQYHALLAYARRRTGEPADAEEVVAETFVVVWRRLEDLPLEPDAHRPWLYGIARRVILNQRRGLARRIRLRQRVREATPRADSAVSRLAPVVEAMSRLRAADQEVLRLAAWEGLSHREIGVVLRISANAAIRLHRARARLSVEMARSRPPVKGRGRIRTLLGWKGSATSRAERENAT